MKPNVFTRHPAMTGETYGEHFAFAASVGSRLVLAGLAALVHAVLPFLFKTTASRLLHAVHSDVEQRRAEAVSRIDTP